MSSVVEVDDIVSKFNMGHLPMKTKFDANIWLYRASKVVTSKIECCQSDFYYRIPTIQVGRYLTTTCHFLIYPSYPFLIKRVITGWITLLVMEDGEFSLIFVQVINPIIIKVAAKSSYVTHPLN